MKGNKCIVLFFTTIILVNCKPSINKTINCEIDFSSEKIYEEYQKTENPIAKIEFDKLLANEWIQNDLQILKLILEEANTSLYRYKTKQQIDSLFSSKSCAFQNSIYYLDYIKHISEIFNFVSCGHSGWSHNLEYKKYRNSNMKFFPLKIHAIKDSYFVQKIAVNDEKLTVFDEIITINGQKPKELNEILKNHMYKDGESAPEGKGDISNYFKMAYSNFISNPDSFRLKLINSKSKQNYSVTIPALPLKTIDSILQKKYGREEGMGAPLRIETDDSTQTAIYTIKWFRNEYIEAMGQNFEQFTDSVFNVLQKQNIQNLIIDLRSNPGGWTANGKYLFSYFISKPLNYINSVQFKKVDSFSFSPLILSGSGTSDTMQFKLTEQGLLNWENYPSQYVEPKSKNSFRGNTYILTNANTRSASSIFSAMMENHTSTKFIGEEVGAAQCGQNGMVATVQLPYTGLIISLSTAQYNSNVKDPTNFRGTIPDYEVTTSILDIKQSTDPQLNKALELIKLKSVD